MTSDLLRTIDDAQEYLARISAPGDHYLQSATVRHPHRNIYAVEGITEASEAMLDRDHWNTKDLYEAVWNATHIVAAEEGITEMRHKVSVPITTSEMAAEHTTEQGREPIPYDVEARVSLARYTPNKSNESVADGIIQGRFSHENTVQAELYIFGKAWYTENRDV